MKQYNCPHCKCELSTNLDEELVKRGISYGADFFTCPQCQEEYRLILIEDLYIQVADFDEKLYDKMMRNNEVSLEEWQRDPNNPRYRNAKYRTWVHCISDKNLNQYFDARKVVFHDDATCPGDATGQALSDAAKKIFARQPKLKSVKLMCYYNTAANTTCLDIRTIHNKPTKISVEHPGNPFFNHEHVSSITWDEEDKLFLHVPILETPFPYVTFKDEIW